jgi:hypothetical protein
MQEAAVVIAVAVAQQAIADGLASTADASIDGSLLIERIRRRIWRPGYPALLAEEISDTH